MVSLDLIDIVNVSWEMTLKKEQEDCFEYLISGGVDHDANVGIKKKQLEYRRMLNGSALRNGLQMMQLFDDLKVLSFSRKYTLLINLGQNFKKKLHKKYLNI